MGFCLSREDLGVIEKRKGNRASPYFISKVESLEDYKKWQQQYNPPEPIFHAEKLLV